jgi:hypothetical protein
MEPDFQAQKSRLEEHCTKRGYEVIFFPKYHLELNFIEQCWVYAKRIYRMFPESSSEDDLECNMLEALESVPLAPCIPLLSGLQGLQMHISMGLMEQMQLGLIRNIEAIGHFL